MKLLVTAPEYYNTKELANTHHKWIKKSCELQNINLQVHGKITDQFVGYRQLMLDLPLEFFKSQRNNYTHVLSTDTSDVLYTGTIDEIISKYKSYGSPPMLTSCSVQSIWRNFQPREEVMSMTYSNYLDKYYPGKYVYRVPHPSCYLTEIDYVIDAFTKMKNLYVDMYNGDEAHSWREAWMDGWFRPERDMKCEVFQILTRDELYLNIEDYNHLTIKNLRLYNTHTDSYPCIFHICGGYSDPLIGKHDRVKEWFDIIYPGNTVNE